MKEETNKQKENEMGPFVRGQRLFKKVTSHWGELLFPVPVSVDLYVHLSIWINLSSLRVYANKPLLH